MRRSIDHILTTHTGSVPRPADLVALLDARERGEAVDAAAFGARPQAVDECVRVQVEAGLAVVSDGEMSEPSFATDVGHRSAGLGDENTGRRDRP